MKVSLETSAGTIVIQLDEESAPKTCANFLEYVRAGFYDGTLFHRVISGFMIQGGGFEPGMVKKEVNPPVANEANNGLKNREGSIAMARTSDPHSATSQFFINASDNAFLDHRNQTADGWGYAVFGRIVDGHSVAKAIGEVPTGSSSGHQDVPVEDVVIERAVVLED